MPVHVVEDGVNQVRQPIEEVKPRDWFVLLCAQPDWFDLAAATNDVRHDGAVHCVSSLAHDGGVGKNSGQDLVGDCVIAAMAKGDPLSKHRAEDKAVPDVNDCIIL